MSNKNNGVAFADQSSAQPENKASVDENTLLNYYITNKKDFQIKFLTRFPYSEIVNALGAGKKNGVHLSTLCNITGLNSRLVRKAIERMRRAGLVILSGQNGYYEPINVEELEEYIKHTERAAKSIFLTLKSARKLRDSGWKGVDLVG